MTGQGFDLGARLVYCGTGNQGEWRVLRFVGNVLGGIFTALTLGMVFAALTVGGIFYM